MPRYARYLFKQYLIAFLIFTLMFGGMVYIVQSVQLLDKIDGRIDSLLYFFGLTLLLLPKLFVHVMPLSMLAALVSVKQRMINDNELVILSTSGQNRWQLAAPGLLLCLGVTVFLALMEFQVQHLTTICQKIDEHFIKFASILCLWKIHTTKTCENVKRVSG